MSRLQKHIVWKLLTLGLLIGSAELGHAQDRYLFNLMSDSCMSDAKSMLIGQTGGSYRSNALDNLFMRKLALGGTLGGDNMKLIDGALSEVNRVGVEAYGRLNFYNFSSDFLGKSDWGWKCSVDNEVDFSVEFPADFFNLVFHGNAPYAGETLSFDGLRASFVNYQKLGWGVFNKTTFSEFSLSLINGYQMMQLTAHDLSFYTSPTGDSLSMTYAGEMVVSDLHQNFGGSNGIGLGLDFTYNLPLKEDKGFLHIEGRNLGFISWNKSTTTYQSDGVWSFQGVDVSGLSLSDIANDQAINISDSLQYSESKSATTLLLPGSLGISMLRKQQAGGYFEFGIRVKTSGVYLPKVHGGYYFMTDAGTVVFVRGTVGGYGRFRMGGGFEKYWHEWYVSLQTEDLAGLILDDIRGRGVWVSLGRIFK